MRMLDNQDYDVTYGTWHVDGKPVPVASTYRVAWRVMAATTGFRTFYPALVPPGTKHVDMVFSAGPILRAEDLLAGVISSSLVGDFFIRSSNISHLRQPALENLPLFSSSKLQRRAVELFLRLNCLTNEYAEIWETISGKTWTPDIAIRNSFEREKTLVLIDILVAISLGITPEELTAIYQTQFSVMRKYDKETLFDANGRKLPKEIIRKHLTVRSGSSLSSDDRTWEHPQSRVSYLFEYPFRRFDREEEMKELFELYDGSRTSSGHTA